MSEEAGSEPTVGAADAKRNAERDVRTPQALVRERARISGVWLIPIVAALVGLYLAIWAWSERGPKIDIRFESAEGLEAGKTKIKFKDVEIGVVESVRLSDDISQVIVKASLVRGIEPYLTETTRFWVVRAQLSAGQVTGLSTVLSGVHIAIDPSSRGERTRRFVGLETPPIVTSDKPGSFFNLQAQDLGSLQVGSPLYFRWLKVGQVAGFELDASGDFVNIKVFVERPHDARVTSVTRFWNVSGLDASVGADGVEIDTPSLVAMVVGGIAFETPTTYANPAPVGEEQIFPLYPNRKASLTKRYAIKNRFLLDFEDASVAGLAPGNSVVFHGIKIGEVLDVDLQLDPATNHISTPVVIEIEPERMGLRPEDLGESDLERIAQMVDRGLRARLLTGNLLTGAKVVELDFVEGAEPERIVTGGPYPRLPTAEGEIEALAERVASVIDKVDRIPLESIGENLDGALEELEGTLAAFREAGTAANAELLPELTQTLGQLEDTLSSANRLISPDSAMAFELERLVTDLAAAARSLRGLAERLEERPEELLRGKSE